MKHGWNNLQGMDAANYRCGYCGLNVAADKGWIASVQGMNGYAKVAICPSCTRPTYITPDGLQTPGVPAGNVVSDLPPADVAPLYEEARRCTSENAFTAAVLCCRKLLMHIAVSKGAKEGDKFVAYVDTEA